MKNKYSYYRTKKLDAKIHAENDTYMEANNE